MSKRKHIYDNDKIVLHVTIRSTNNDDFHVGLQGHPEIWDCGKTLAEAVGRWLETHIDYFEGKWDVCSLRPSELGRAVIQDGIYIYQIVFSGDNYTQRKLAQLLVKKN